MPAMQESEKQAGARPMRGGRIAVLVLLGVGLAAAALAAWSWRQQPARPSPKPFRSQPAELPRRDVLADWQARFAALPEGAPERRTWESLRALGASDAAARGAVRQASFADPRAASPLLEEALRDERDAVRAHAREILLELLQDPERRRAVLGDPAGR
jgi:hypothetical protein